MYTKATTQRTTRIIIASLASVIAWGTASSALASSRGDYCSITAGLQYQACRKEVKDDLFTEKAICVNVSDEEEREECFDEASESLEEAIEECRGQRRARKELCGDIGEARYDPSFEPDDFQTEFNNLNPYLPLAPGNKWTYESEDETVVVTVTERTKLIEGVTCVVVNDVVTEDDQLVEDTDDWFGQRTDGTIDYCGEEAKDYEYFDGDLPPLAELVEIEGSFKAGRDGDKSGTLFMGTPVVGAKYRQEWSPSNAEDVAEVLSTNYGFGSDARFDPLVPEELADLMCGDNDCVVTADTSPLEPDALEYKFYARGVGFFFEVKPEDGEALGIVECNTDPKCEDLESVLEP